MPNRSCSTPSPQPTPRATTAAFIAWIIVAIVLLTGVAGGVHRALTSQPDWDDLRSESQYVWQHRHTAPGTAMFGYLPATTFALWPFTTWLPQPLGAVLFVASNLLAALISLWIVHRWWWRSIGGTGVSPVAGSAGTAFVWPVLLVCANLQHALQANQLTLWTLALCLAGLTLVGRRRGLAGGLFIGLAAAVKVLPAVLIGYLLLRRRWRALGGVLLALVVFDVLPSIAFFGWRGAVEEHAAWLRRAAWHSNRMLIEQPGLRVHRHGSNASLAAVLTRWLRAFPDATHQVILYGDPPPEGIERYRAALAPDEVLTLDPMPPRDAAWAEKRVDLAWVPRFHIADLPANVVWWLWATPLIAGFVVLGWFTYRKKGTGSAPDPVPTPEGTLERGACPLFPADCPALSALWLTAMFWPSPMTRHYYLAWAFPAVVLVWNTLLRQWRASPRRWSAGTILATSALAAWLVGVVGLGSKLLRWYGLHLAVLALLTAATAWAWSRIRK